MFPLWLGRVGIGEGLSGVIRRCRAKMLNMVDVVGMLCENDRRLVLVVDGIEQGETVEGGCLASMGGKKNRMTRCTIKYFPSQQVFHHDP
jgi:hypothetical protein